MDYLYPIFIIQMAGKSKKIKILFTIPNFDTAGSGKALFKIASGLDREVFEPHIACLHNRGEYFKVIQKSGIPVHVFEFTSSVRPVLKGLYQCWRKSRFFLHHGFHLVHSFHYGPDYSEPLAAKIAGVKWGFTKKNMNWGGASKNGWKIRSYLADFIALQNSDMKNEFYPDTKKTFYVPRGVDTAEFFKAAEDKDLKQELGLDKDTKVVLNVANMVPVKGLEVLIRAFKNIVYHKVVLILVGDNRNEYGRSLENLVRELGLENRVIFTGKTLNVKRFLSIADLFVLPTLNEGRKEGSPVAMLEAMASGVPVIGTKIPGVKDQLKKFPDAQVDAGDISSLAARIDQYLFSDRDWRLKFSDQLCSEVQECFDLKREIKRHEQMYIDTLKPTNK
ncbi:glycosyltransferase involved in cell wall biosynthesis [Marinilabilia salmonicolor]|uniref:Glycosyltransferase involved in cell wall biosynthesis n=2 Tax=Marinilabilia salmonicolor TaxID=989 RepID=A0A368V7E2_9BACT|nr:glycosyltransferase involved in cell wall biosynthesis [Marinilabilia salmonicolor]